MGATQGPPEAGRPGRRGRAFDEEAGFEVCRKEGIEAVVIGSYVKAGETFVTDVKVLDAATRESLRSASARGEGVASILKSQIDEISRAVGRGIGKPLLKLEAPVRPIMELTTSSLEAYNLFLRGREAYEKFYYAEAKTFLEKALALDPDFAIAYMILAETENQLGDSGARKAAIESAYRHSAAASEKERLMIAAWHAHVIESDPDRELRLLQEFVRKFPDEKYARHQLGFLYEGRGEHDAAIAAYEKALALDPNFGWSMNQLAYVHARAGRYAEALRLFERYAAISPGDANPLDSIAELYVRMGNLESGRDEIPRGPGAEAGLLQRLRQPLLRGAHLRRITPEPITGSSSSTGGPRRRWPGCWVIG